jgi:hypothetical protein
VELPSRNLADSAPPPCPICGEHVDASQTAVAVMNEDGSPGLVHPACYPAFSAQQRARGNDRFAESPLRDLQSPRREDASTGQ